MSLGKLVCSILVDFSGRSYVYRASISSLVIEGLYLGWGIPQLCTLIAYVYRPIVHILW